MEMLYRFNVNGVDYQIPDPDLYPDLSQGLRSDDPAEQLKAVMLLREAAAKPLYPPKAEAAGEA